MFLLGDWLAGLIPPKKVQRQINYVEEIEPMFFPPSTVQ